MENNLPQDLDFLLEKQKIEDFLIQNSEKIFGEKVEITIKNISRSKSYAPESYAMYYTVVVDGQKKIIRISGSTIHDRIQTYQIMEYLYKNGFDNGDSRSPKPLAFIQEYNLMIYEDVPGRMLKDYIAERDSKLQTKIVESAHALMKFHLLPKPQFQLEDKNWDFDQTKILKYAPVIIDIIKTKIDSKLKIVIDKRNHFCHGDFQPKNIIIGDVTYIIDFGSAVKASKELDIACFTSQLSIMLEQYGNPGLSEDLSRTFLTSYGEFDKELYEAYYYLYQLEILQALIVIYEEDPNADRERVLRSINNLTENIIRSNNG